MDMEPIVAQLSKLSNYFYEDTTIEMSMSKFYHDFAVENFILYKKYRSELHSFILKLMDHMTSIYSSSITDFNIESLIDKLSPYKAIIDKDMNEYDAILKYPIESMSLMKDIYDFVSKTEGFNDIEKLDYTPINVSFLNSFKYGIAAISFEAFSCEALINETLLKHVSRNQLDKLQKKRSYNTKFHSLIEILEIDGDSSEVSRCLDNLMKARNDIAHYKGIKYKISNLINIFIHNDKHQDELFYYGETLIILENDFFVHDKLYALLTKKTI